MGKKRKPEMSIDELRNLPWKMYMKTTKWRNFSKSLLSKDDCQCQICKRLRWRFYSVGSRKGSRKPKPSITFNVHHRNYDNMGQESEDDMLVLCGRCHDYGHLLYSMAQLDIVTNVFKKIYITWCKETAWEYTPFKERIN